jgi:MOSC domain-containing protein YiiM
MVGTVGRVTDIFIAPASGAPVTARDEVKAIAGRGLDGDRHYHGGTLGSPGHDPADEITLIEVEGLARAHAAHGLELDPGEHRRQVVVEGIALLPLVGRKVLVGDVEVEVLADNPGCRYLQDLTGKPVLRALRREGGVRGAIVSTGVIRIGDQVTPADPADSP